MSNRKSEISGKPGELHQQRPRVQIISVRKETELCQTLLRSEDEARELTIRFSRLEATDDLS